MAHSLNLNQSKSTDYQWKLTDLTVKNIFFTDESVKINWFNSENLTDSDLESSPEFVPRSPRFKPRCRGLPATWDSAPLVLWIRLLLVDNFHIGLFRPGEKGRLLNFTTSFVDAVPRDAAKCQATPWLFLHIFILMHAFTACLNVRDEKVDFAYEKEELY